MEEGRNEELVFSGYGISVWEEEKGVVGVHKNENVLNAMRPTLTDA